MLKNNQYHIIKQPSLKYLLFLVNLVLLVLYIKLLYYNIYTIGFLLTIFIKSIVHWCNIFINKNAFCVINLILLVEGKLYLQYRTTDID